MKKLTLEIPENVNETRFKKSVAAFLFDQGILSSGQAANLSEISKREFIESVGKYGISIFGETEADLETSLTFE